MSFSGSYKNPNCNSLAPIPKSPDFGNDCCLAIDREIVVNRVRLEAQKRVVLLLRKLAVEMAFNIFMAKRDSCLCQYDRIHDLITCKLSGDKRPMVRQFSVEKLNFSAVSQG